MVYKIGNIKDLDALPPTDESAKAMLYHYASVLSSEYGEDRDVDRCDGGYILYIAPHAEDQEVKTYFDYSLRRMEYADRYGDMCCAVFLLNNEYAVIMVARLCDMPAEITKDLVED